VTDIVAELREDAKTADGGEYPEDACRWAITMRAAADEIAQLRADRVAAYQLALSMIGDMRPKKLHELLKLLECRDLLREQRRATPN
jgi:hypothetical protein